MDYTNEKSLNFELCDEIINFTKNKKKTTFDMTTDNKINNLLLKELCFNIKKYKEIYHIPFDTLSINHYTVCNCTINKFIHFNNIEKTNVNKKTILTYIWALNEMKFKILNKEIYLEKGAIFLMPCEWFYNIQFNICKLFLIIGNVYTDI